MNKKHAVESIEKEIDDFLFKEKNIVKSSTSNQLYDSSNLTNFVNNTIPRICSLIIDVENWSENSYFSFKINITKNYSKTIISAISSCMRYNMLDNNKCEEILFSFFNALNHMDLSPFSCFNNLKFIFEPHILSGDICAVKSFLKKYSKDDISKLHEYSFSDYHTGRMVTMHETILHSICMVYHMIYSDDFAECIRLLIDNDNDLLFVKDGLGRTPYELTSDKKLKGLLFDKMLEVEAKKSKELLLLSVNDNITNNINKHGKFI